MHAKLCSMLKHCCFIFIQLWYQKSLHCWSCCTCLSPHTCHASLSLYTKASTSTSPLHYLNLGHASSTLVLDWAIHALSCLLPRVQCHWSLASVGKRCWRLEIWMVCLGVPNQHPHQTPQCQTRSKFDTLITCWSSTNSKMIQIFSSTLLFHVFLGIFCPQNYTR